MKILIIEDDPTQRLLLDQQLARAGHQVFSNETPETALDLLRREEIQFLVTDWEMPVMNGPQLIQKIREADLPYYVYIVMLTGKQERSDVVLGLNAGADDYLTKPFDAREFIARVRVGERIVQLETKLRQANQEMETLVNIDYLTGMLNRRAIYAAAEVELERSRRTMQPVGILFIDLDGLKKINDQNGHLAGDAVLKSVAQALCKHLRPYDLAGRWAGDEFLLILPGADIEDTMKIAERIRLCIFQTRVLSSGNPLEIHASFGVHTLLGSDASRNLNSVIEIVDEALYRSKQLGGNQIQGAFSHRKPNP